MSTSIVIACVASIMMLLFITELFLYFRKLNDNNSKQSLFFASVGLYPIGLILTFLPLLVINIINATTTSDSYRYVLHSLQIISSQYGTVLFLIISLCTISTEELFCD